MFNTDHDSRIITCTTLISSGSVFKVVNMSNMGLIV